ncbi:MAG: ribonuclease H [Bacteriovoracaceae bacterium]|jgi:ribonuclease HI|nr:ribonuclease H [Bacteriovoracaceae bacterium]
MDKELVIKKIEELESYFSSKQAKQAIKVLKSELNLSSAKKKKVSSAVAKEFVLPKEVVGNQMAFALFTDGACRGNPGPGSFAYMIQSGVDGSLLYEAAQVSSLTTNNKMELKAIIEGLKYLSEHYTPMHQIFVYTDSKYAVDGIKSWVRGWKKRGWKKADKKSPENLELWQQLDHLNENLNVSFHWVKAHAGHPQNEYVDGMANEVLDKNGY